MVSQYIVVSNQVLNNPASSQRALFYSAVMDLYSSERQILLNTQGMS